MWEHPLRPRRHYDNHRRQTQPFILCAGIILADLGLQDKKPSTIDYRVVAPWTATTPLTDFSLSKLRKEDTQPCQYQPEFTMLLENHRYATYICTDGSEIGDRAGRAVVSTNYESVPSVHQFAITTDLIPYMLRLTECLARVVKNVESI